MGRAWIWARVGVVGGAGWLVVGPARGPAGPGVAGLVAGPVPGHVRLVGLARCAPRLARDVAAGAGLVAGPARRRERSPGPASRGAYTSPGAASGTGWPRRQCLPSSALVSPADADSQVGRPLPVLGATRHPSPTPAGSRSHPTPDSNPGQVAESPDTPSNPGRISAPHPAGSPELALAPRPILDGVPGGARPTGGRSRAGRRREAGVGPISGRLPPRGETARSSPVRRGQSSASVRVAGVGRPPVACPYVAVRRRRKARS
ncbi:hypothetical protein RKD23_000744 [Streptomyces sp. SAI-170]